MVEWLDLIRNEIQEVWNGRAKLPFSRNSRNTLLVSPPVTPTTIESSDRGSGSIDSVDYARGNVFAQSGKLEQERKKEKRRTELQDQLESF
jgi:hypothetical protein